MKTIKEWQRAAYELAVKKGFHHRESDCPQCHPRPTRWCLSTDCGLCDGTGTVRIPIDPHSPTRIASRLALVHCEISKAVECVARGRMGVYTPVSQTRTTEPELVQLRPEELTLENVRGLKLEGFPVELADVFLRLCDLAESLDVYLGEYEPSGLADAPLTDPETLASELSHLHGYVSDVHDMIDGESFDLHLRYLLIGLLDLAVDTGVDLLAMAELKHEFNKTRPIRHGGKAL